MLTITSTAFVRDRPMNKHLNRQQEKLLLAALCGLAIVAVSALTVQPALTSSHPFQHQAGPVGNSHGQQSAIGDTPVYTLVVAAR